MESQPQSPGFRINPENFYPWQSCAIVITWKINNNKNLSAIGSVRLFAGRAMKL